MNTYRAHATLHLPKPVETTVAVGFDNGQTYHMTHNDARTLRDDLNQALGFGSTDPDYQRQVDNVLAAARRWRDARRSLNGEHNPEYLHARIDLDAAVDELNGK